jgi:hypothetical protein
MGCNTHFFLGLLTEAETLITFRKSLLIEANNFRVGTLSNGDFLFFSMGAIQ